MNLIDYKVETSNPRRRFSSIAGLNSVSTVKVEQELRCCPLGADFPLGMRHEVFVTDRRSSMTQRLSHSGETCGGRRKNMRIDLRGSGSIRYPDLLSSAVTLIVVEKTVQSAQQRR